MNGILKRSIVGLLLAFIPYIFYHRNYAFHNFSGMLLNNSC